MREISSSAPLRILLADDHALVRAGIRALLDAIDDFAVIGEAGDGAAAIEMVGSQAPDLVVMDFAMKGMNGVEAVRRLKSSKPGMKLLMLTMYGSEEYVLQALNAGADGYLLKDSAADELEHAIRAILGGATYLDSHISREQLEQFRKRDAMDGGPADILTPRQRQILQLIAEGHNTKEIAWRLDLSSKTVETHRAQIMERLEIRDVPGLVRYAIRHGMTTPEK